MSYTEFARYYDVLTRNVGYAQRAEYLCTLLERYHHPAGTALDLACGTGSLTLALKRRGIDICAADASVEMLTQAQQKAAQAGETIFFLHQKMQQLTLAQPVDTIFCTLDSLNHLPTGKDVQQTFSRVAESLRPDGMFVFDMNTPYKHREVLGNHVFVYDTEEVYCVWQNRWQESGCRVGITLDFFVRTGSCYQRTGEQFYERAYETDTVLNWLQAAGLQPVGVFEECTFQPPTAKTERIVFAAQKQTQPCSGASKPIGKG